MRVCRFVFPLPFGLMGWFSDRPKAGRKVGAAFIHFHPPDPTTRSHLHPPDPTTRSPTRPTLPLRLAMTPRPTPTRLHNSITGSHLLSLPWHMFVFDAELYVASCALQYAASLSPPPRVVSLAVDNQAAICAISRPGYSYQASPLHDICKATSALLLTRSTVQVGWIPSHTGITGNELADAAAAKLAAEGTRAPPRRLPVVVLSPAHTDPQPAPLGVADLAQAK